MGTTHKPEALSSQTEEYPKPRLWWLAAFDAVVIGLVVLGGARLAADRHRQPEGIAIAPDGTPLISDEAAGKTATITGYACRR